MNIYVSNLGFNLQDEDLRNFFTPYGEVTSAKIIIDRMTNQSRGFGFVEMADETASQKAITELNGSTVENRAIKVMEAKPREDRSTRTNSTSRDSGSNYNNSNSYNQNRY